MCAALRALHCSVPILTTRGSTAAIDPWRSQGVVAPVLAPWGTLSCLLDKGLLGRHRGASGIPTLAVVECRPHPVWCVGRKSRFQKKGQRHQPTLSPNGSMMVSLTMMMFETTKQHFIKLLKQWFDLIKHMRVNQENMKYDEVSDRSALFELFILVYGIIFLVYISCSASNCSEWADIIQHSAAL